MALISYSLGSLGSIDEGIGYAPGGGSPSLFDVWDVIQMAYSGADQSQTVFRFDPNLESSSAADSSDFSLVPSIFIYADGTATVTALIVQDDSDDEPDEPFSFQFVLSSLTVVSTSDDGQRIETVLSPSEVTTLFRSNLTLDIGKLTGTIIDNDLTPNTAPTAVNFINTILDLDETSDTTSRIKVADITITDDGKGTNNLSLTGTDAGVFELDGTTLYLKAGTVLDYESGKTSYSVTVNVDDPAVGITPDASNTFTLSVNDLPENRTPTAVNDSVNTYRGVPTTIAASTLLANDTDPDAGTTLKITGVSNATNGTVSLNSSGDVVFTATNTGDASFQYTISDGSLTSTATVAVSVGLSLNGGNGIDILKGSDRDDLINGNGGADALYGNKGKDSLNGGSGNDLLLGGEGDDLLNGSDSADALYGGRGNDTLTGGSGKDIFAFTAGDGSDTITDFADGSDKIGLVGLRFSQLTITASGSGTVIKYGSETLATLTGVSSSLITAADFIPA